MKLTTLNDAPAVPFDIDGRVMYTGAGIEVIHLSLAPGERLDMHDNPFDVVFYMLSGAAYLLLENGETLVTRDSCLPIGKGILRGWHNRGDEKARLLVIKQTG